MDNICRLNVSISWRMREKHSISKSRAVSQTHKSPTQIHGGAWRDPNIDASVFQPTILALSKSQSSPRIKGYASINYRLSPHPKHPASADDPSKNAKHPDHINDVSEAVLFLEKHYSISTGYMLIGHSCGATLTFQLPTTYKDTPIPAPLCALGSEGIYDFVTLIKTHESIPDYLDFITSAFGSSESVWAEASPASSSTKTAAWQQATVVVISQSPEDQLVDQIQADLMLQKVKSYWDEEKKGLPFYMPVPATGNHDDVWKTGDGLALVISKALDILHTRG